MGSQQLQVGLRAAAGGHDCHLRGNDREVTAERTRQRERVRSEPPRGRPNSPQVKPVGVGNQSGLDEEESAEKGDSLSRRIGLEDHIPTWSWFSINHEAGLRAAAGGHDCHLRDGDREVVVERARERERARSQPPRGRPNSPQAKPVGVGNQGGLDERRARTRVVS